MSGLQLQLYKAYLIGEVRKMTEEVDELIEEDESLKVQIGRVVVVAVAGLLAKLAAEKAYDKILELRG